MAAWKELYRAFNESPPDAEEDLSKYNDNLHDLRTNLIAEVAKSLGKNLDSLKLHKGGYRPMGWQTREEEEEKRRHALTDVLLGNRFIRVCIEPNTPEDDSHKGLGAFRDR